jgi:hypothetical protein
MPIPLQSGAPCYSAVFVSALSFGSVRGEPREKLAAFPLLLSAARLGNNIFLRNL